LERLNRVLVARELQLRIAHDTGVSIDDCVSSWRGPSPVLEALTMEQVHECYHMETAKTCYLHLRVAPKSHNQNPGQKQVSEETITLRRSLINEEVSGREQTPLLFGPDPDPSTCTCR
jgi:hypothetical protein